jgi:hypothetical protein
VSGGRIWEPQFRSHFTRFDEGRQWICHHVTTSSAAKPGPKDNLEEG